jgi:hypothetical protein
MSIFKRQPKPPEPKNETNIHNRHEFPMHTGWPITEVLDAIIEYLDVEIYVGTDGRDGSPMLQCRKKQQERIPSR